MFTLNNVAAQLSITNITLVQGVSVNGVWKKGSVLMNDGTKKNGETRASTFTGDNIKSMKFRLEKGAEVEVFKAEDCKYVEWDNTFVISLPKNFKKPTKGNMFYTALYSGENISVLMDPDATVSEEGLNKTEKLNVLVLKKNELTKVTKMNFKGSMKKLCADNKTFIDKTISDKKWFKYDNLYTITHYYNQIKAKE